MSRRPKDRSHWGDEALRVMQEKRSKLSPKARIAELEAGIEIGNKLLAGRDRQIAELEAEVERLRRLIARGVNRCSHAGLVALEAEARRIRLEERQDG